VDLYGRPARALKFRLKLAIVRAQSLERARERFGKAAKLLGLVLGDAGKRREYLLGTPIELAAEVGQRLFLDGKRPGEGGGCLRGTRLGCRLKFLDRLEMGSQSVLEGSKPPSSERRIAAMRSPSLSSSAR